jgi:hypothetical protein
VGRGGLKSEEVKLFIVKLEAKKISISDRTRKEVSMDSFEN